MTASVVWYLLLLREHAASAMVRPLFRIDSGQSAVANLLFGRGLISDDAGLILAWQAVENRTIAPDC